MPQHWEVGSALETSRVEIDYAGLKPGGYISRGRMKFPLWV
jgi:hypothetical protein